MKARRRVLVVGAGVSGLTLAHELTRTPAARARWQVELVEMGHKVGGRLASAHRPEAWQRNEEHGLHVWFGFYDNTFRLADEVWRDWQRPEDCPWHDVHDGLRPIWASEHGLVGPAGLELRRVHLPRNGDRPGVRAERSRFAKLGTWVDLARALSQTWQGLVGGEATANPRARRTLGAMLWPGPQSANLVRDLDQLLGPLLARFEAASAEPLPARRLERGRAIEAALARVHPWIARRLRAGAGDNPGRLELARDLDLVLALVRGLCSPEHDLLADADLDRISSWELSEWLAHHGAQPESIADSALLECLYDIPFAYRGGDRDARVLEASTALRYTYRIFADYKHALAYLLQAGAGETLIAPLFELCRERGLGYRPFHRLVEVELDASGRKLERLVFVRAARVRGGPDRYDPLVTRGGLRGFTADPDWAQLEQGEDLAARGVDFYSRFGDQGERDRVTLERGRDFDDVVLALPLGSIVPDGDGHSPVQAWLDAHPPARACIDRLHLVPTVAAQLWFEQDVETLGLVDRAAATWGRPYSVICNMSPVISHEAWPEPQPGACVYVCGAWPLRAPHAPSSSTECLVADRREARRQLEAQLEAHAHTIGRETPQLYAPPGAEPWAAQYVRVNVEPWDLADLALPGADALRLEASESGLDNLALAGAWLRTPVNTTSVEAAVCAGLAAARALGAETRPILAESFLRQPSRRPYLPGRAPQTHESSHVRPFDPSPEVPPHEAAGPRPAALDPRERAPDTRRRRRRAPRAPG